ncbi:hypothetical protein A6A03_11145 [Chloroflexus islandicus]|uniref:DUF3592 domain-containing protein n=2 Tax=Chloroflexus islandicus TaxID=1707952 RepID=A0A178ME10_9CHLR|nr:hypothetical protein A6A03_11145 [Chloroflexus islandicus]
MKVMHIVIFFLLGLGLMFLSATAYIFFHIRPFQNGLETQGAVIGFVKRRVKHGKAYAPLVRFVARNGQEVTITGIINSEPPAYQIGQIVTVAYPLHQPEQARIKGKGKLFLCLPSVWQLFC